MSKAYYNEIDKKAAAWLRELIKQGHIAQGDVDERSISDVRSGDLAGYTQCHFFAGIGVWSYALRQAGWPDDRAVWTGSCPCQSFSSAGKGAGFADERHLWPSWYHLISQCRPDVIFGEQVEAAIRHSWLDLVQTDMENIGYAFASFGLPAAGFGAPHIRQRLYFVAESLAYAAAERERSMQDERHSGSRVIVARAEPRRDGSDDGATCELVDGKCERLERTAGAQLQGRSSGLIDGCGDVTLAHPADPRRSGAREHDGGQPLVSARPVEYGGVGDATSVQSEQFARQRSRPGSTQGGRPCSEPSGPSATNGFWSNAEWLPCRDGKARPVEPGVAPLVDGATARVVKLRGYGNAIVAPVAQEFIQAYIKETI